MSDSTVVVPAFYSQREWFERTGHCGGCGQPGEFCLCAPARSCACRDLHPMGSGIKAAAVEVFADAAAGPDQDGLF